MSIRYKIINLLRQGWELATFEALTLFKVQGWQIDCNTFNTGEKQMKPKEFYDLVVKMRKAQKDYFATRTKTALEQSKQLEREVDAEIRRVENVMNNKPTQQSLF